MSGAGCRVIWQVLVHESQWRLPRHMHSGMLQKLLSTLSVASWTGDITEMPANRQRCMPHPWWRLLRFARCKGVVSHR
jgi:hypothetical protein